MHKQGQLPEKKRQNEQGFVLATALVMLSLLTLLAVAMYYNSKAAIQISSTAQHSTEGHYYAETAVNYMIWARRNDAEFDNFNYPTVGVLFPEPSNGTGIGDRNEILNKIWDPGPTTMGGTDGQVMYFDNSPMAGRAISWPAAKATPPVLYHISTSLPRYIRLDIDAAGAITPAIPPYPHADPPVVGVDIPDNGAIVWLTTGNSLMDFEVDPNLGCTGAPVADVKGCDVNPSSPAYPDGWLKGSTASRLDKLDEYGVVVYAIGYVNGRPSSIIRAQVD